MLYNDLSLGDEIFTAPGGVLSNFARERDPDLKLKPERDKNFL